LKDWIPVIAAVVALAIGYFFLYAPERDRRLAMEKVILAAAINTHSQACKVAMTEEGLDAESFERAGGHVSYLKVQGGLVMQMNADYLDTRKNPAFCEVSLIPNSRVSIWQPDAF